MIRSLFRLILWGVLMISGIAPDTALAQVKPIPTLPLKSEAPAYQLQVDTNHVARILDQTLELSQPDSIRSYLEGALKISREIGYQKGILKALSKLSEFELEQNNVSGGLRYSLENLRILEKEEDSLALFYAYQKTGNIYSSEGLHAKALEYYKKALPIHHTIISKTEDIQLHRLVGNTYAINNEPDSAMYHYNILLDHFEADKDTAKMVNALQSMGEIYSQKEDYTQLLDCNLQILDLITPSANPAQLATAYNNIGYSYNFLEEYKTAVEYFLETLMICKKKDYINLSVLHTNLGIAYNNLGKKPNAIKHFLNALKKLRTNKLQERIYLNNLIATAYYSNGDLYNATQYNEIAINLAKSNRKVVLLSDAYRTGAAIHEGLYDFELALNYYSRHLELRDSINFEERLRQQSLLQQQFVLERSEKEIQLLLVNQEISELTINQLELEKEKLRLESDKFKLETDNLKLESKRKEDELALLRNNQEIEKTKLINKELENQKVQQELAISQQRLLAIRQQNELQDLQQKEEMQRLELDKQEMLQKEKEQEIQMLTSQQKIDRLELERQAQFRQFVYGLGILTGLIILMILSGLIYFRKANRRLAKQKEEIEIQKLEIEQERNKSERLLLNILPAETANELKNKGSATPRQHPLVSVLFTDFSRFTQLSQTLSPEELIKELSICFGTFDEIIERHGLEKIKTIGDSYMCAGGIPTDNETNPSDAVAAAIEMQDFMNRRFEEKARSGIPYWKMRVGIHTGKVIAGVVGSKKFAYDIWGDTVNTASRLESSGVEGKVNISEDTYRYIEPYFDCHFRGEIVAKHKGKLGMYFVEQAKS